VNDITVTHAERDRTAPRFRLTTMPGEMDLSDTEIVQSQPSDGELFREALDTPTLRDFENPKIPIEPTQPPQQKVEAPPERSDRQRDEQGRFQKAEKGSEDAQPDGNIPSFRLREESEARRRAEQELSELRAQIAAFKVSQQQQQPPQKKLDIFDDPSAFVRQEMQPVLEQLRAEHRLNLERQSTENAQRFYGHETVDNAYNTMAMGMRNSDPQAWAIYHSAMGSHDPFGVITRWFVDRQTLNTIGGDLEAYKKSILEQAMRDPEYQRQVFSAARGGAVTQINRPVQQVSQSTTSLPPSLSEIGAAGGDELIQDASDEALFRAAVTAKRRPTLPGR